METVTNTVDRNIPQHYIDEQHAWDVDEFRKVGIYIDIDTRTLSFSGPKSNKTPFFLQNLKVQFHYNSTYDASFSLVHVSAPVANAFRRIMIATLPTVAIERVYIYNNTTVMQDEVLASRLGLLPLTVPKRLLEHMYWPLPKGEDGMDPPVRDIDHLIFKLNITCTDNPSAPPSESEPTKRLRHAHVYARDLEWQPIGRQASWLGLSEPEPDPADIPEDLRPQCANPDILICKLRKRHQLELEMHAVKGCGADHAKFCPVATATYRLLPTIDILQPIIGDDAVKFQSCFPPGVIALEEVTAEEAAQAGSGYQGREGEHKAVVKDAFSDTVSRECLRHEEFNGKVKLGRQRDHFIFSVESVGQHESHEIFAKSVRSLRAKCLELKEALNTITQ